MPAEKHKDWRERLRAGLAANLVFVAVVIGLTSLHWLGVPSVPFHPDESTYIYMASDFERLVKNPIDLAPGDLADLDQKERYRLIDAPLTRYLIGGALLLSGRSPVPVDWDWSASFEQNTNAGALPSTSLLVAARLAVASLIPLSMIFLYAAGRNLAGTWTGLLAAVLLGAHSLVLVHARRAMTEGALLFATIFFLWAITRPRFRPILVGTALALAVNAKHSALFLLPVALAALVVNSRINGGTKPRLSAPLAFKNLALFLLPLLLITLALNPVVWREPVRAVQVGFELRVDMLEGQRRDTARLAPNQLLDTPLERAVALAANLFLLQPSFQEVGNYAADTAESEAIYLARPEALLGRGPIAGILSAVLFAFGLVSGTLDAFRGAWLPKDRIGLLLLATVFQAAGSLAAIPLPWQRYVVPLLPFTSLWTAIGIVLLGRALAGYRARPAAD